MIASFRVIFWRWFDFLPLPTAYLAYRHCGLHCYDGQRRTLPPGIALAVQNWAGKLTPNNPAISNERLEQV